MDSGLLPETTTPTTHIIPFYTTVINAHSDSDRTLSGLLVTTTSISTGIFTVGSTAVVSNGLTSVIPVISTGTSTVVTRVLISSSVVTSMQSSHLSTSRGQTKAIVGGVAGAAGIIILGLIIFFVLRHKRRYKASCLASARDAFTSSNVPGQCMPQSAQISTVPRPFLDFSAMQNHSPSKEIITNRARTLLVQNLPGGTKPEPANPFRDPVITERNLSDNEGEGQQVRNALDNLQALTSRFEGELQQLGALAQSGQLSAEDRLKLEEIRRTTGLTIQLDSRRDRFSIVRSASSASSPSFAPPSYHTRGD